MPKRIVKPYRYEAEMERTPLSPALERRLRRVALSQAPKIVAAWRSAEDEIDRFYAAPSAAMAAFLLGARDSAQEIATQSITMAQTYSTDWNYGNAMHYGHTVLGLLGLQDHKLELALDEFRKSGETPGSPQLNSFGPTMHLARELLHRGEFEPVLQYLEQCSRFWHMGHKWLSIWQKKVERRAVPNFFGHIYR